MKSKAAIRLGTVVLNRSVLAGLAVTSLLYVAPGVRADDEDGGRFKARLNGYQEVSSISTTGIGRFVAELDGQTIRYVLSYSRLEGGAVTAAHIHFAQKGVIGSVSAFLCGGGDKPPCPNPEGTVRGVIDPTDVIGPADRGIEPGSFAELVRAMQAGVTYVNVHTGRWPGGEIRGQISGNKDDD